MAKTKLKEYHFDKGNSTKGAIGYCAVVRAHSKAEAVEILKRAIPVEVKADPCSEKDEDNEAVVYIEVYINENDITEKDIDEVLDADEEDAK